MAHKQQSDELFRVSVDPEAFEDGRIRAIEQYLTSGETTPPPPPIAGGRLLRLMPRRAPAITRALGTRAVRPRARRQWAKLSGRESLKLHLGCGYEHKEGWVNIDLFATRADICWDLARGIPLADCSVEAILHEHLLEHLNLATGFAFTRECHRVLTPGGVLRIGVPDAGELLDSYSGKADPGWAESRPTRMLAVQAAFYEHGHRAMYDADTLTLMCRGAGFAEATRRMSGEGWIQPSPDTPDRSKGTLYVEARKRLLEPQ
jgi:predicted SAM-dependent methyltransferase